MNVNVHVGGGGSGVQRRPKWFGDRSHKGRPDIGGHSGERDEHAGGKGPRPPRPETNETR